MLKRLNAWLDRESRASLFDQIDYFREHAYKFADQADEAWAVTYRLMEKNAELKEFNEKLLSLELGPWWSAVEARDRARALINPEKKD